MLNYQRGIAVVGWLLVATCSQALAQAPPAPPAKESLFSKCAKLKIAHINKKGCHPEKEKKPLLKAIADPANLQSKNAAIQTAAQIKTEEDLAPQKVKAIKYLGAVGCGCYPGVKDALLAALDDCTEEVRYAAAVALIQAAGGCAGCMPQVAPKPHGLLHLNDCDEDDSMQLPCGACAKNCCDEVMKKKLYSVAYDMVDGICYKEPSARVREAAAEALAICNSHPTIVKPTTPETPAESIPSPAAPETAPSLEPESPPVPPAPGARYRAPKDDVTENEENRAARAALAVLAPPPPVLASTPRVMPAFVAADQPEVKNVEQPAAKKVVKVVVVKPSQPITEDSVRLTDQPKVVRKPALVQSQPTPASQQRIQTGPKPGFVTARKATPGPLDKAFDPEELVPDEIYPTPTMASRSASRVR